MTMMNLSGRPAVLAALTSGDLTVPPAPPDLGPPSLSWLRAHVARFSDGADHARRRAHTKAALARADPQRLRHNAFRQTTDILGSVTSTVDLIEVDVMERVARTVPVRVLADALGIAEGTVPADVAVVARQYLTGPEPGESTAAADSAVARLVHATRQASSEEAAAIVGVLVQSYEATAGLIGNSCLAMLRAEGDGSAVVDRTLREDPPTLATRRVATVDTAIDGVHIGAGETVRIELASAGLALGAGPHACPGAEQARAIAAGAVDAIRGWRLVETEVEYVDSTSLRVPSRLIITRVNVAA